MIALFSMKLLRRLRNFFSPPLQARLCLSARQWETQTADAALIAINIAAKFRSTVSRENLLRYVCSWRQRT
jgi:hypothetical protein